MSGLERARRNHTDHPILLSSELDISAFTESLVTWDGQEVTSSEL